MLRVLIAGLVAAVLLQLWGAVSAALLPWPDTRMRPLPPPTGVLEITAPPAPEPLEEQAEQPRESSSAPISQVLERPPELPLAFSRTEATLLDGNHVLVAIGTDLAVGLLAALLVLAIPKRTPWRRQLALLLLAGLGAVALGDLTRAVTMRWPASYVAALCTDHFAAIILAAGGACIVMRSHWPLQGTDFLDRNDYREADASRSPSFRS